MGRRANGEGSIDFVPSRNRYRASVSLPNGKRKQVYGRTRAEVAEKLTDLLKSVKDGLPVPSDRLTMGGYLDEWSAKHATKIRASTADRYARMLRVHVGPVIGSVKLSRLEPRDLDRVFATMHANGSAPATIRQARAIIGRALRDAERQGLVARNVAKLTDPPKVERREMECLNPEQARAFLTAAQDPGERFGALFVLAISHGLRLGELTGLRWDDLDLDAGTLTVRNQLQAVRGPQGETWKLVPPKTARSRRALALSTVATEALRAHRARQAEERLRMGPAWDDSWGLVFTNEIGRPVHPSNLTRRHFQPLLKRAELPRIRFHDLRHSAATLLLSAGEPVVAVSASLGHSQVSTTLNTYAHAMPEHLAQVATTVDRIFGTGTG
ncbi:MAG: site-specific integrase [Alphaproteobacteria bacterium]|nr:site-specific integrase [Alphaproteobacteria bacterium]